MTSILPTIAAKSDQLNAEDLIGGPRTIRITGVTVKTSEEQPVWVHFEGDDNKPYKPCKTMRRLLVRVWGDDSDLYAGRSMTIYLDPEVKFGGMKVGGIRISHMSGMDGSQSFYLTETRGKKRKYIVKPLASEPRQQIPQEPTEEEWREAVSDIETAETIKDLLGVWNRNKALHTFPAFVEAKDKRKAELTEPADGGF